MISNSLNTPVFSGSLKVFNPTAERKYRADAGGRATLPYEDTAFVKDLTDSLKANKDLVTGKCNQGMNECRIHIGDTIELRKEKNEINVILKDQKGNDQFRWVTNLVVNVKQDVIDAFNTAIKDCLDKLTVKGPSLADHAQYVMDKHWK